MRCVAPTLIQEAGPGAKPIERKRAELASVPAESPLSAAEVVEIRELGDNTGSMLLKGATPDHDGEDQADRWRVGPAQAELAERWGIDPERDLRRVAERRAESGLQQVGALLERLCVLRARLVQALGVVAECLRLGRGAGVRVRRGVA